MHQPVKLIDEFLFDFDMIEYFGSILTNVLSKNNSSDLQRNFKSTQWLIKGLISDVMGKRIDSPIEIDNPYYSEHFPIT